VSRLAIVGFDIAEQLFGKRNILGEKLSLTACPIPLSARSERRPGQQLQRSRQQQDLRAVRGHGARHAAARREGRRPLGHHRRAERLGRSISCRKRWTRGAAASRTSAGRSSPTCAAILARRHGFDPNDKQRTPLWDTSLNTLMFGRMISNMKTFFSVVGIVTLSLGGIGVMNIMLNRGQGANARNRRPQGAGRDDRQHPAAVFFSKASS